MLHRLRATVRFPTASGMAAWAHAQMVERHGMARDIREGEANEEPRRNEIIDEGDHQTFHCDLPLLDAAHAADAFATLTAASVLALATGWRVAHHVCYHDEIPPKPCEIVARQTGGTL